MRKWRVLIGLLISLVCLALAVRGVDWLGLVETLAQADGRLLMLAAGALILSLVARGVRWRILLRQKLRLYEAFAVVNVGYLVSNVLPFRLGDPARAVIVGRKPTINTSSAFSTVVVERVLDMLAVVLMLALSLPFIDQAGPIGSAGVWAGLAALLAFIALVLLARWPGWGRRTMRSILNRLPGLDPERWLAPVEGLLDGLSALRSARRTASLVVWTGAVWISIVGYYWAMLGAFLDRPSLAMAAFVNCAVGLGMAVPAAPGAVGVFHALAKYALVLPFGVPGDSALAIAFAMHGFQYVLMNGLGIVGLIQQNLSVGRLRSDVDRQLSRGHPV